MILQPPQIAEVRGHSWLRFGSLTYGLIFLLRIPLPPALSALQVPAAGYAPDVKCIKHLNPAPYMCPAL